MGLRRKNVKHSFYVILQSLPTVFYVPDILHNYSEDHLCETCRIREEKVNEEQNLFRREMGFHLRLLRVPEFVMPYHADFVQR